MENLVTKKENEEMKMRRMKSPRVKYKLYDAFPTKSVARSSAKDLRSAGDRATVKKIAPQDSGRLKYGVFYGGRRKKR